MKTNHSLCARRGALSGLCHTDRPTGERICRATNGGLAAAVGLVMFVGLAIRASGVERYALPGYVAEPVAKLRLQPLSRLAATNQLKLAIALSLRNTNELGHLLQDIYNPGGPQFRHYLTPEQFTAQFGPTESDYKSVVNFAHKNGLKVTGAHPNRLVLDVTGSVAEIENTFHVRIYVYQHPKEPRTFYAPDAQPALDASLRVPILSISGLDNYALPHPAGLHLMSAGQSPGRKPKIGSGPSGAYLGRDFRNAYVPGSRLDGTGQSVALVEFDGYYTNDITAYENMAGLPRVNLTNVLVDGGPGTPGAENSEVALDIEMVIAMATNVANVLVYEAPKTGSIAGWLDLLSQIADDNLAAQIGCSWGFDMEPIPGAEQIFQKMAAQGQSFFNACGDQLAFVGFVFSPADSPSITQVGGTSLTTTGPGGPRISETVWNQGLDLANDDNKGEYLGTGGGISPSYSIPLWQQGINSFLANGGSSTARNVPDVALTAQNIYVRYDNGTSGTFGGTSCAAPLWAGFMALVNQQAAAAGVPRVGFINPAIYEIANESIYDACFNDIVTGNNTWPASPKAFYAVPGYDLCTGLGTPKGTNLINALVSPDPLIVVSNGGFSATKSPDGTFNLVSQTYYLTNAGTAFLDWTLVSTSAWLNVSNNGGTLAAGAGDTVTVSLNTIASNLTAGTYSASVWFSNLTSGVGHSRLFTLTVSDPLVVQRQKLSFHGPSGGPFTPDPQGFLLTNPSTSTVNWATLNTSAWFNLSPSTGSLAPGGQTNLAFMTSPAATNLADGFYTNIIQITNLISQYVQPVTVILSVAIVQNGGFETGDFSAWTLVGNGVTSNFIYNAVVDANYGGNHNNWGAGCVHSGVFGACLGDTNIATLSQNLPTIPGQKYLLSFWQDVVLGPGELFRAYWNTNQIYSLSNPQVLPWARHAFVVKATDTNTTLQFVAEAAPNAFGLDDVSVVAVFPPSLTSQPTNLTVLAGSTASFATTASGTAPMVYQWTYHGTNLLNGPGISGVTTPNLTMTDVTTNSMGDYALVVANNYGSVTSSVATLTVVLPPTIAGLAANPDGSIILQLGGSPGATYILVSKSDLGSPDPWLPVATNLFDSTGLWQFTDPQATNVSQKYYRLKYTR